MSIEDKISRAEKVALIRKHSNDCEWWHRPSVCTCAMSGHNAAVKQAFKDLRDATKERFHENHGQKNYANVD